MKWYQRDVSHICVLLFTTELEMNTLKIPLMGWRTLHCGATRGNARKGNAKNCMLGGCSVRSGLAILKQGVDKVSEPAVLLPALQMKAVVYACQDLAIIPVACQDILWQNDWKLQAERLHALVVVLTLLFHLRAGFL